MSAFGKMFLFSAMLLFSTNSRSNDVINQYLNQAQYFSGFDGESVNVDASWLDQPELRYSASDEDEYGIAFRFRPRFESQREAENRIADLLNRRQMNGLAAQLNDELQQRYNHLLELIEIYDERGYLEQKAALSHQHLALTRSLVQTESFRIDELQAAELQYHRDQQQLPQLEQRLRNRLQEFTSLSSVQLEAFLAAWPQQVDDWDGLLDLAGEMIRSQSARQLEHAIDRTDLELAQQKLRLARSESASWLKFIELKLVDRPSSDQEASFSMAIPLGSDDLGVSQRAAEVNRASVTLQSQRLKTSRSITRSNQELNWLADQAALIKSTETLLKQQYDKLKAVGQAALVIKLKAEILNYRNELRRLHVRGLRQYIALLHTAGYLARPPLTNWLLRARPKL